MPAANSRLRVLPCAPAGDTVSTTPSEKENRSMFSRNDDKLPCPLKTIPPDPVFARARHRVIGGNEGKIRVCPESLFRTLGGTRSGEGEGSKTRRGELRVDRGRQGRDSTHSPRLLHAWQGLRRPQKRAHDAQGRETTESASGSPVPAPSRPGPKPVAVAGCHRRIAGSFLSREDLAKVRTIPGGWRVRMSAGGKVEGAS